MSSLSCKRGERALTLDGRITLLQAVGEYCSQLKDDVDTKELERFVGWCGPRKAVADITPAMIGDYAEKSGGTGTNPQAAARLQEVRKFLSFAHKKGIIKVRLAQHVRARKPKTRQGQGVVQHEDPKTQLTAEGHKRLMSELESLKSRVPQLSADIQRAAADKDVRENAPLEAAREEQGRVVARIREIEAALDNSVVMDSSAAKRAQTVRLGVTVEVKMAASSDKAAYTVVSASEADPRQKKISDASPLGKALMGRSEGSEVEIQTPRGKMRYQILSIS